MACGEDSRVAVFVVSCGHVDIIVAFRSCNNSMSLEKKK